VESEEQNQGDCSEGTWQAKQSIILHTTVMFYGNCVKMYEVFARTSATKELRTGYCIMTTQLRTLPFYHGIFCQKQNDCCFSPTLHARFGPPPTFLFPQFKIKLKGSRFDTVEVKGGRIASSAEHTQNTTSRLDLKIGIMTGNSAYVQKRATWRVMVASRPKVSS
jgi:hypothetical protein